MKVTFSCPPEMFGKLPEPQLARRTAPEWYRAMPMENVLPEGGQDLTVKHCMPFLDALTHGFIMPLQADITVKDGQFDWDWPFDQSPLSLHFPSQAPGMPFVRADEVVIKAHNFWSIRTEPGWSVLFTHPLNRLDLPFRTLSGLVDTDSFDSLPVHFPMMWTDRAFSGVLPAGTPVAQCIPVKRDRLEIEAVAMTAEEDTAAQMLKQRILAERGYYKNNIRRERT